MDWMIRSLTMSVALACSGGVALSQPSPPEEPLRIAADFARFRGDDHNVYVEVYYSVPQRLLTYAPDGTEYKAGIELLMTVAAKDSLLLADRLLMPHRTPDPQPGPMNLVSLSNMMLPPGEYVLTIVAKDINNAARRDSLSQTLSIKPHTTKALLVSDLEFASSIKKGESGSPFYKNTLEVIPNPEGIYSDQQSCFYYAEAYNLLAGDDRSDYFLRMSVLNAVGKEIISRERPRKRAAESAVLVDNFDVSRLRSGTYTLVLSVLDSSRRTLATSAKKFYVYNSRLGIDSSLLHLDPALSAGVYTTMNEEDLDREFKWARWESTDAEKTQYNALQGVEAKRKFLTEFWGKRPAGKRELYLQRVALANRQYNVLGREGYRTDRGRVHIMYGPPDDIERHPNEAGTRPYEIWSYNNIQGGVIFVFVLRQEGGDYELVHSTHRNELHDENWIRYAQTN